MRINFNYIELAKKAKTDDEFLEKILNKIVEKNGISEAFIELKGTDGFGYKNAFLFEKSIVSKLKKISSEMETSTKKILESEIDSKVKKILTAVVDEYEIFDITQLHNTERKYLLEVPGIGEKTLCNLEEFLKNFGVELI